MFLASQMSDPKDHKSLLTTKSQSKYTEHYTQCMRYSFTSVLSECLNRWQLSCDWHNVFVEFILVWHPAMFLMSFKNHLYILILNLRENYFYWFFFKSWDFNNKPKKKFKRPGWPKIPLHQIPVNKLLLLSRLYKYHNAQYGAKTMKSQCPWLPLINILCQLTNWLVSF